MRRSIPWGTFSIIATVLLAAVLSPARQAALPVVAAEASKKKVRGGIQVQRERPRLFVGDKMLPAIRARAHGTSQRAYHRMIKKDCDRVFDEETIRFTIGNPRYLLSRVLSLLVCHRVEEEPRYMEKALAVLDAVIADGRGKSRTDSRTRVLVLAVGYDWLHDCLPAAARERLRSGLVAAIERESGALSTRSEFVSGVSHFATAVILIGRLALWDGSPAASAELERALAHWEKYMEVTRHIAKDGGHHLGWRYGRSYPMRVALVSEAITTATGRDVFAEEEAWLKELGYHLVYGLRPDNTYFRIGDSHRAIDMNLDEDAVILGILSSRYRDGNLAAFADRAAEWCLSSSALAPMSHHVFPLLFADPSIKRRPPESLPPVRGFRMSGNYIMRTGWDAGDTAVLFRAMPWYHFNHERRDFGSFQIYHRGALAIHGGTYMAGDEDSDYNGPHLRNYAWRTAAHNTITVLDPGEEFRSPFAPRRGAAREETVWSNDGGQKIRSERDDDVPVPHYQPRNLEDLNDPRFAQGSVEVFDDGPEATCIVADGTRAYRGSKVKLFERHFLYLKKPVGWKHPVIVILDRVESTNPSFRKTWLLHTVEEPRLEDRVFVIENRTRIRFTGGKTPQAKDYWQQYSGKLHSETVLPAEASLQFVGGEGKEFWVDGKNHPAEVAETDLITEPGIGRIEVSPSKPRAFDLFLHVLSPTEADDPTPRPRVELLEATGSTALRAAGYVIVFAGAENPRVRASGKRAAPPLSYSAPGDGSLVHVITGLPPSRSSGIYRNGTRIRSATTSGEGVLTFRSGGGNFKIE
jgi:heparin/heparan-sulfate lyase